MPVGAGIGVPAVAIEIDPTGTMIVEGAETDEEVVVAEAVADHTEPNGLFPLVISPRGAGNNDRNSINRSFDTFSVVSFAVEKPSDKKYLL